MNLAMNDLYISDTEFILIFESLFENIHKLAL